MMAVNLPDRITSKIMPEPNSGCWLWTASLDRHGYGQIMMGRGNLRRAHRIVYEHERGPIPAGLDLDHKCRNRACVNPDHLEPVTRVINLQRGIGNRAALHKKTQCPNGHEYADGSFEWRKFASRKYAHRMCLICLQANAVRNGKRRAVL